MRRQKENMKKGFLFLSLFFILCLGLGILVGSRLLKLLGVQEQEVAPISLEQFLLNFALAIGLVFIIIFLGRKFRTQKKFLLKGLFLLSVAAGSFICLGVFIGDLAILLITILIFLWFKKPNVLLQDILVVLAIAGAGAMLGIRLETLTVILLLIVFSLYDYIAVYKTKHMVKMARTMIEEGAIIGLILPKNCSDFWAPLSEVQPGGQQFFILGGGDVVFPLIFCVSVLPSGLTNSLVIAVFSCAGLLANFYFFSVQKKRKPIPALPLIALFSIIGFLITKIVGL